MRKIMNRAETFVQDMCRGIADTNPNVVNETPYKIIRRRNLNPDKVTLISGGGSGHEPAHAGYVGVGMLDAAVCGDVFASPSQIQVYKAIRATAGKKGTLLVVKNYSGDVMNFKNAAAMAEEDGFNVDYVIVDDDIAVRDSLYTVGRRGVAGTVLVHKVAGAAAEMGLDLAKVKAAAEKAVDSIRSIGFALSSCTVPAKGSPTFSINDGEMEYGVGIHGEPGVKREKVVSAHEIVHRMTNELVAELALEHTDQIAVLVNGFGGTPLQELYLLADEVKRELHDGYGIEIYRMFAGNYMTSIDMMGASLTFMKLDNELKRYLDAPSDAPGFRIDGPVDFIPVAMPDDINDDTVSEFIVDKASGELKKNRVTLENIQYMIAEMGKCILENEEEFCRIDSYAGDGDFGMSVAKGFRKLKNRWPILMKQGTISSFLQECSMIIMEFCGGASGPVWGSAFRGASNATDGKEFLTLRDFADMMQSAVRGIQVTGERSFGRGAVVGDKTLIDALAPFANSLQKSAEEERSILDGLKIASKAAVAGAKATEQIVARMGRAGVVGERSLGYPDAGAYALGYIFTEVTNQLS